jgi:gas vesicle protein
MKAIAQTLAGLAEDKVGEAQSVAKREARNLARSGQQAVEEVQDEFGQLERQIKDTIREKPLTAVAGAIALGYILAVVSR